MAVIFTKTKGDNKFEVRTAGASVRLYSNGVLHSQYNPNKPISGAIWDLLVLPGFFLKHPPKKVLVLGLGGGSVIHLIRHFFPSCDIHCVELEKQHIHIAKRYFKIPDDITVIHGDAYQYLANTSVKYDWILDDVFQHISGEPERDVPFEDIFSLYENVLVKDSVLSMNTIGVSQLKQLREHKRAFQQSYVMRHPLYDNAIVTFTKNGRSKADFFAALSQFQELDTSRKTCCLNVSLRAL